MIYNSKILPSAFYKYNTSLSAMLCLAPNQVRQGFCHHFAYSISQTLPNKKYSFFSLGQDLYLQKQIFSLMCVVLRSVIIGPICYLFSLLAMQLLSRSQLPLVALTCTLSLLIILFAGFFFLMLISLLLLYNCQDKEEKAHLHNHIHIISDLKVFWQRPKFSSYLRKTYRFVYSFG